jgi:SAM-dependent methyltransferase
MNHPAATNREGWNLRTPFHANSEFYGLNDFLKGRCSLKRIETELCGAVQGRKLLHLQCHFGIDTLCWARRGAKATGVDFSSVAIGRARELARESGLEARFIEADVESLDGKMVAPADLVVSTYGALCWLQSLEGWAAGIAASLALGGRLVLVEFHPYLDLAFHGCVSGSNDYFSGAPSTKETSGTYADRTAPISYVQALWQHPTSEVITALLAAGLSIRSFREYPYCSYQIVPELQPGHDGYWYPKRNSVPFLYSIVAEK